MAIHRVIVRGFFDGLDPGLAARLRAAQADHDVLSARFVADGSLVYGSDLGAFSFRFEVRTNPADGTSELDEALRLGTERAVASLERMGAGYKHLRATGRDMADVWK